MRCATHRYLELQSSGRKDELRLHYVSRRDGTVHVEAFPFRLADGAWHRVALSISGSQVELLVDCHPLYRRLLRPGPPDTNFTLPQLQLWVGQRNVRHFLFKVRSRIYFTTVDTSLPFDYSIINIAVVCLITKITYFFKITQYPLLVS